MLEYQSTFLLVPQIFTHAACRIGIMIDYSTWASGWPSTTSESEVGDPNIVHPPTQIWSTVPGKLSLLSSTLLFDAPAITPPHPQGPNKEPFQLPALPAEIAITKVTMYLCTCALLQCPVVFCYKVHVCM